MNKEISSIKDLTKNENSKNSFNNSVNIFKKNFSMYTLKNSQKLFKSKNYFKLSEKDKINYKSKMNKRPYSYHLKEKNELNINNDIMSYIKKADTINKNDDIVFNTDINITNENDKYDSYTFKHKRGIN